MAAPRATWRATCRTTTADRATTRKPTRAPTAAAQPRQRVRDCNRSGRIRQEPPASLFSRVKPSLWGGELHRDAEPSGRAGSEGQRSVVRLGDALDDRQAEADACSVAACA